MSKRYNDGFDIIKAVLALFIVGIHTILSLENPIYLVNLTLSPLFRLAVPIFFIFSGYFFFKKELVLTGKARKVQLCKSVSRYGKLYLFWFVLLLPITIVYRGYLKKSILNIFLSLVNGVFLGSTFPASWYISSLAIAIIIVFLGSLFLNNLTLFSIALIINVLCTLATNYGLTPIGDFLNRMVGNLPFTITLSESFLIALLWIVIGKMFAENQFAFLKKYRRSTLLVLFLILLYCEQFLNLLFRTTLTSDSFLMLVPVCVLLFSFILDVQVEFKIKTPFFRAFSTITYCMHISVILVLKMLLRVASVNYQNLGIATLLFGGAVLVSTLTTIIIINLEKKRGLRWLRFSH